MKVQERYDAFQKEAVSNVIADFKEEPAGRFLLVIPTGGGKTTTAVKAVSGLYLDGLIGGDDRVLWVVHREELKVQAKASFDHYSSTTDQPSLPGRIDIRMLSEVGQYLKDNPGVCLAVVDEAHHAAAKSYQPLFERPNLGILGLTATPSRHDGQPLRFSRESYSIGFPDLVQIGVLLRPTVIRVEGGTYDINDIGNDSATLEVLNNEERNKRIVAALTKHKSKLDKVIVYAATKQHARDIFQMLKASLSSSYEAISLILGGDERRRFLTSAGVEVTSESRAEFISAQKSFRRSVLVNVDVLTEGYDDPTVNAIVMARPTNSKLVYMQALGRAVRIDPENDRKDAYVIEVDDVLPNITYRIDNRWLYSDISDLLEPDVTDVSYASSEELQRSIRDIFARHDVPEKYSTLPQLSDRDRITVLLFKIYLGSNKYGHVPIVITNATRQAAAGFFNYLADRMGTLKGLDIEQVVNPVRTQMQSFSSLTDPPVRKYVVEAMENAWELVDWKLKKNKVEEPSIIKQKGYPWISFVAFRKHLLDKALTEDFLCFTDDMHNKENVRESLLTDSIGESFYLLKFPLPLSGTWGVFLPPTEFEQIKSAVEQLRAIKTKSDSQNQWQAAMAVIGTTTAYVEQRHVQSLTTIVREDVDFFRRVCDSKKENLQ